MALLALIFVDRHCFFNPAQIDIRPLEMGPVMTGFELVSR